MILSDNETKVDLLNNEAIAKTIVSLIKDSKEQPISIGIHGDWGAGKSSILEMVENEVKLASSVSGKKYSCIRFNGWKHQGFEDSKVALMSSIISELEKKEKLGVKSGEILKKLWENINWMTVAKTAGKTALGIATGTAPLTLLSSTMDILKSTVTTEEGIAGAIESIGGYLSDAKITEDMLEIIPEQCGIYCICNYSRHILNDNVYILRRNNKITHMLCNDLLRKLS